MSLQALSFGTLGVLFSLIFIGGYVSSSGVGLTCPEWPLCPHGFIPAPNFIIEYIHRTFAASTAALVIMTMAFTLKSKNAPKQMKLTSVIAAGAVIGQVTLGGIVIIDRLHSLLVTGHLALGLILFSMVLMTAVHSWKIKEKDRALEARGQPSSSSP